MSENETLKVDFNQEISYTVLGRPFSEYLESLITYDPKNHLMVVEPKVESQFFGTLVFVLNLNGEFPAACELHKKLVSGYSFKTMEDFTIARSYNPHNSNGSVYRILESGLMAEDPMPLVFIKKFPGEDNFAGGVAKLKENGILVPESGIGFQVKKLGGNKLTEDEKIRLLDGANKITEDLRAFSGYVKTVDLGRLEEDLEKYGLVERKEHANHYLYFSSDGRYCLEVFPDLKVSDVKSSGDGVKLELLRTTLGYELVDTKENWKPLMMRGTVSSKNVSNMLRKDLTGLVLDGLDLPRLDYIA